MITNVSFIALIVELKIVILKEAKFSQGRSKDFEWRGLSLASEALKVGGC